MESWVSPAMGLGIPGSVEFYPQQMQAMMQNVLERAPSPTVPPVAKETLTRSKVPVVKLVESESADRRRLANRARKLLGYEHYASRIEKDDENRRRDCQAALALAKLGIDPLDDVKVQAYKVSKAAQTMSYWTSTALESYDYPVPEFVLLRACELKEELPLAKFEVEYMRVDPFLVMVYGSKRYYIDVWDEPKFEGRRTV